MEGARQQAENGSLLDAPELKEQIDRAKAHLEDLDTRFRRIVEDKPLVAVGAALAVGYVLGRLLRRR
jgi:ElaB/YqjD/DUF883 family membrane-anchored ribosome-binding protein